MEQFWRDPCGMAHNASTAPDNLDPSSDRNPKRRKLRKGTHSCWACKRRKEKCLYDSTSAGPEDHPVCVNCRRRGTKCVSQEFEEETPMPEDGLRQIGDRVVRVESMMERLVQKYSHPPASVSNADSASSTAATSSSAVLRPSAAPAERGDAMGSTDRRVSAAGRGRNDGSIPPTPCSLGEMGQNPGSTQEATKVGMETRGRLSTSRPSPKLSRMARLSETLLQALPSKQDLEVISSTLDMNANRLNEVLTTPFSVMETQGPLNYMQSPPEPDTHPILIARFMLRLANNLQHCHPDTFASDRQLSEPYGVITDRLTETAFRLVTSQEHLLGSIEGLECVMLEVCYQSNCGNLRLSWLAGRRAIGLAQLMGFHHPPPTRLQYQKLDPLSAPDPHVMWFRILNGDRFLSLMLGLPHGSSDRNIASDAVLAADTPLGRIERMHCLIAAQLLERNETETRTFDCRWTKHLDFELQKAARTLPTRWWLPPSLEECGRNSDTVFWGLRRLMVQMNHYNLLNQMHVPYLLSSSRHVFAKIACVNASREVLTRFITLRSFNRVAYSCRLADFYALMAAMTLLFAHLDSHRNTSEADGLLAHHYHSDRAMMEQAQENMAEVSRFNDSDPLSAQSADLLGRLLAIEAEAAAGVIDTVSVQTQRVDKTCLDGEHDGEDDDDADGAHVVRVYVPYFGIIRIAREGVISREPSSTQATNHPYPHPQPGVTGATPISAPLSTASPSVPDVMADGRRGNAEEVTGDAADFASGILPAPTQVGLLEQDPSVVTNMSTMTPLGMESHRDGFPSDLVLPGLTARASDWTFQGIDTAFFDNLMRGSQEEEEDRG